MDNSPRALDRLLFKLVPPFHAPAFSPTLTRVAHFLEQNFALLSLELNNFPHVGQVLSGGGLRVDQHSLEQ
jgi:hypothetical protein